MQVPAIREAGVILLTRIFFEAGARVRRQGARVRGWSVGMENIGKRLVNNREKVEFQKPQMTLDKLLRYGQMLVDEQENVKRVQLAEAYMSGAELAGVGGSSMPEEIKKEVAKVRARPHEVADARKPKEVKEFAKVREEIKEEVAEVPAGLTN